MVPDRGPLTRGRSAGHDRQDMANIHALVARLQRDSAIAAQTVHWEHQPAQAAQWADWPAGIHPDLQRMLLQRGHTRLYTHQREVWDLVRDGQDVLVTTPTASGKTLACYLPILDHLLRHPRACTLYLAPTKALAQDQCLELKQWAAALPPAAGLGPDQIETYDGDTPREARRAIRTRMRVMISNPDMLNRSVLPFHRRTWKSFLAHLAFVFVDEIHVYRGIFGSHVANLFLRLERLLDRHRPHRRPQWLAASATVANVQEFSRLLTGRRLRIVARNGAPQGERHILFCNPPMRNAETGWRDTYGVVQKLAELCRAADVQCLVFARTRREVELVLTDLQSRHPDHLQAAQEIRGYRGGYLPALRREIERGLRDRSVKTVVATNALELGIDIGSLECVIMKGYPGTIASTRQQIGRAGRRQEASVAVLVAGDDPVDQYLMSCPEFLFDRAPEHALINPRHPHVLLEHLACALEEKNIRVGQHPPDPYGCDSYMTRALQHLAGRKQAYVKGHTWLYMGESSPARRVRLRNIGAIYDISEDLGAGFQRTIATLEADAVPRFLYPQAIYLHDGQKYRVETLDTKAHKALVRALSQSDQFTVPVVNAEVQVLDLKAQAPRGGALVGFGEVRVSSQVVACKLMRRFRDRMGRWTTEQVSVSEVDCRPQRLTTQAYWVQVPRPTQLHLEQQNLWRDSENEYGPLWQERRAQVRAERGTPCSHCGKPEAAGRQHDVHHIRPFRTFGYVPGLNRNDLLANAPGNLRILCRDCHRKLEPPAHRGIRGLSGLGTALHSVVPFYLMCDVRDVGMTENMAQGSAATHAALPSGDFDAALATIFIHEKFMGGMGFSPKLYAMHEEVLDRIASRILACECDRGCPACVGPPEAGQPEAVASGATRKSLTLSLVKALCAEPAGLSAAA